MELIGEDEKGQIFFNMDAFEKMSHIIGDIYPLAGNLLKAIQDKKTFVEWVYEIPTELVDKYVMNDEMKEDQQDEDIFLDKYMTAILFLGRFKETMGATHPIKEIKSMIDLLDLILANLSIVLQMKKDLNVEILKFRSLNSQTWHPDELYIDSYLKHISTKGKKSSGTIENKPQTSYTLPQMMRQLNK